MAPELRTSLAVAGEPTVLLPSSPSLPFEKTARKSGWSHMNSSHACESVLYSPYTEAPQLFE